MLAARCWLCGLAASAALATGFAQGPTVPPGVPEWEAFFAAASTNDRDARRALAIIAPNWRDGYAAMIVDLARLLPSPSAVARERGDSDTLPADSDEPPGAVDRSRDFPSSPRPSAGAMARRRLTSFLEKQTRQRHGDDLRAWRRWMWARPDDPHPDYALFKAELYGRIDARFRAFFPPRVQAAIRLDEIDWGGVGVNGIPPLRRPAVIPASEATYLRDSHIVFGIVQRGVARAYPRRILAWHEMAIDRVGDIDITLVYCTLCGTVIPYESRVGERGFTFGTSGLLYRSNKLMFDEETRSLWSALGGEPVVGPLVGQGLRLAVLPVVTTTWGEWRRDHPETTVLSLATGYERDYGEGVAYRDYFASDRLMFEVPLTDRRLRNKAEVLVLRADDTGAAATHVAIAVERLARAPVFHFEAGGRAFVVVTSKGGANRVYRSDGHTFVAVGADGSVRDAQGRLWRVQPDALDPAGGGPSLPRVAAHRAFWFGWIAQHPDGLLIR